MQLNVGSAKVLRNASTTYKYDYEDIPEPLTHSFLRILCVHRRGLLLVREAHIPAERSSSNEPKQNNEHPSFTKQLWLQMYFMSSKIVRMTIVEGRIRRGCLRCWKIISDFQYNWQA